MCEVQPLYSEAYRKVIDLAKRYAAGTSDRVMRLKHLLVVLLDAGGDASREILGVTNLVCPVYFSFKLQDKEMKVTRLKLKAHTGSTKGCTAVKWSQGDFPANTELPSACAECAAAVR